MTEAQKNDSVEWRACIKSPVGGAIGAQSCASRDEAQAVVAHAKRAYCCEAWVEARTVGAWERRQW